MKAMPIESMRDARVLRGLPLRVPWVALALAALLWAQGASAQVKLTDIPMPELRNQSREFWINSKPLTKADLKGSVVLIEVWTSI
jgi:hypothetical protein